MNIYVLCLVIFLVRIVDTSLATIRTILMIRNKIFISTFIAFFEVLVWFLIVKEAINTSNNSIFIALSYSLGFAVGIFLGIIITNKFTTTYISVNVVINNNKREIFKDLTDNGFAFSTNKIKGRDLITNKYMLFIVTTSKKLNQLKEIITLHDNSAFIVVSEDKYIINGFYK